MMNNSLQNWPNGTRVALVFQLMLEQWAGPYVESGWHLCPSISADEIKRGVQDLSTLSWQAYGGKAGFYRLMDMTHRHGIVASGVFSGVAIERYPDVAQEFVERGNEIVAHGWSQEIRSFRLTDHDMLENIKRTQKIIQDTTGYQAAGWMSPMAQPGENSMRLLAQEGFLYTMDSAEDDYSVIHKISDHTIVSVPTSFDVNDHQIYLRSLNPPSAYVEVFKRNLDVLIEESRQGPPRVMSAVFNANLYGHPLGTWALQECIRYAKGLPDIWITTHRAHAEHLLNHASNALA